MYSAVRRQKNLTAHFTKRTHRTVWIVVLSCEPWIMVDNSLIDNDWCMYEFNVLSCFLFVKSAASYFFWCSKIKLNAKMWLVCLVVGNKKSFAIKTRIPAISHLFVTLYYTCVMSLFARTNCALFRSQGNNHHRWVKKSHFSWLILNQCSYEHIWPYQGTKYKVVLSKE